MVALASVVTRSYLPGLEMLALSLRRNGGLPEGYPWVFLTWGDVDPGAVVRKHSFMPVRLRIEEIQTIKQPGAVQQLRFFTSWYKLYLLGLDNFDLLASIDLDMVCLGDVSGMLSMEHLSAPPDMGKDGDRVKMISDFATITTAFAVFKPDRAWVHELEAWAVEHLPTEGWWRLAEMSVLNDWLATGRQDMVRYLPEQWATHERRVKDVADIKLLHLPGATKWWEDTRRTAVVRALVEG